MAWNILVKEVIVAITYTITEGESVMGSTSAAEVAEHVVLAGASYTVQGTPEERVEGTRRVEDAIQKRRDAAKTASKP